MKRLLTLSLMILFGLMLLDAAEIPAKQQDHPISLIGGTIHTVSNGLIQNGTILFDKGKILAIGIDVSIPADAEKINVEGKDIYPGLIDPNSTIGLTEIDAVRASNDIYEVGSINPNLRAEAAVNPESEIIPVTRANGVTMALSCPNGGVIGGRAALLELDGWTWEEMTYKSSAGLVVNWPSMTITHAWWERRSDEEQRKDRDRSLNQLRNAFRDARAYWKAKASTDGKNAVALQTDLRWEAMKPFLDGAAPVLVNAGEVQQIQAAVAWAKQEGINIVIVGGYDAWRVAELLKMNTIPVITGSMLSLPWRRFEGYDEPMTLPKKLYDAGVQFCIGADGAASNERNLPYHAAMAAAYGLPKDEALKAITLSPAQILGVANRTGSLEPGKDATLIVTTGDILEIQSQVVMEYIRGKMIPLSNKQTRLYEKYTEKYQRLKLGNYNK